MKRSQPDGGFDSKPQSSDSVPPPLHQNTKTSPTTSPIDPQEKAVLSPPSVKFVKATDDGSKLMPSPSKSTGESEKDVSAKPLESTADDLSTLEKIANDSMDCENGADSNSKRAAITSPMMLLNLRFPGINSLLTYEQFEMVQNGALRAYFKCHATLMGQQFDGAGWTKKEAKQSMAKRAIEAMPPFEFRSTKRDNNEAPKKLMEENAETVVEKILISAKYNGKNPIQVLHEILTALKLGEKIKNEYRQVAPDSKPHETRFVCEVKLVKEEGENSMMDTTIYESEPAVSKKVALRDACKKALAARFNVDTKMFDQVDANKMKDMCRGKNPIQVLHELCVQKGFKPQEESHTPCDGRAFRFIYKWGDHSIEGESSLSKRDAKRVAAIRFMKEVFGIDPFDEGSGTSQDNGQTFGECSALATATESSLPQVPPVTILQRIAATIGAPLQFEKLSVMPRFGIKATCGIAESTGYGHTKDEAKTKAAIGLLNQMEIGQYFGYPPEEEEEAVDIEEQPQQFYQPPTFGYFPYQNFGMAQSTGWMESYGDGEEEPEVYQPSGPAFEYQRPYRSVKSTRGTRRGGRGYANDLRAHFSRPL